MENALLTTSRSSIQALRDEEQSFSPSVLLRALLGDHLPHACSQLLSLRRKTERIRVLRRESERLGIEESHGEREEREKGRGEG